MLSTAAKSRGATLDSGAILDPEDRSNSWSSWPWFYDLESAALSGGWVGNAALPAGIDGGADRTATVGALGMEIAVPSPAEKSGNNGWVGTMANTGEPSGGANREIEQSLQLTDSETEDRQP